MPAPSSKSLGRMVTGFWVFNLVLGFVVIGAWLLSSNPAVRGLFQKSHSHHNIYIYPHPNSDLHQNINSNSYWYFNKYPLPQRDIHSKHHPHRLAYAHSLQ